MVNIDGVPEFSTTPGQKIIQAIVGSGASVWVVTYQNTGSKAQQGKHRRQRSRRNHERERESGRRRHRRQRPGAGRPCSRACPRAPAACNDLPDCHAVGPAREALPQIAAAIVGQYALTYARTDGPTPKVVQVGETQPGVTIHYPSTPIK